ncbi:MAG: hypothetical protein KA791_00675 [Flavobacteriales bacterium]|nr:hypothetical protein [Flavobacteriales bacterium]
MKSAFCLASRVSALAVVLIMLLFATGCSKHEDDCPAPESKDQQATTRSASGDQGDNDLETGKPSGLSLRGTEAVGGETGGDGISDDGDDEADGEGNKKTKPAH